MEFERRRPFQRNKDLERLLTEVNSVLKTAENEIIANYKMPQYPLILIVGCARCGSTLIMQWLAQTGQVAYPTNMLSRFYGAPFIGAKIQRMLTEFDHNQEIFDFSREVLFASTLGKTKGALAPHEFWYFWRRFFPDEQIDYSRQLALDAPEMKTFVAELAAIESVFDKPLAMKGNIINWNIPYISSILDKVLFIYIKRHPFYNMQSLLEAREKYFGDRRGWYSFKPKEYLQLKDLDPFAQVAGQLYYTNRAIEAGLGQIAPARQIRVNYEQFCAAPAQLFSQILEKFMQQCYVVNWSYHGPDRFQTTDQVRLSAAECDNLIKAYEEISNTALTI